MKLPLLTERQKANVRNIPQLISYCHFLMISALRKGAAIPAGDGRSALPAYPGGYPDAIINGWRIEKLNELSCRFAAGQSFTAAPSGGWFLKGQLLIASPAAGWFGDFDIFDNLLLKAIQPVAPDTITPAWLFAPVTGNTAIVDRAEKTVEHALLRCLRELTIAYPDYLVLVNGSQTGKPGIKLTAINTPLPIYAIEYEAYLPADSAILGLDNLTPFPAI